MTNEVVSCENYYENNDAYDDKDEETNLWSFKLKNDLNKVSVILFPTNPASV